MFKDEIDKSMEVYVDDMLVKRNKEINHIFDLNNFKFFGTIR